MIEKSPSPPSPPKYYDQSLDDEALYEVDNLPEEDEMDFSLTELSVLIRILKLISLDDIINLNEFENLNNYLKNETTKLLGRTYERFFNDFGGIFFNNLEEIINYHSENYHIDIGNNNIPKGFEQKVQLIFKKLVELRLTMDLEKYADFLNIWGILPMSGNETLDNLKSNPELLQFYVYHNDELINNLLKSLSPDMFELLYNHCRQLQIKKNLYIFWHLFGFVRKLIHSFVEFHNSDKHYNIELDKRAMETKSHEEISIRKYMENYDIFEVKANKFQQIFNQMNKKHLSLIYAESTEGIGIIYHANFHHNTSIEVHPVMEGFLPLIYTNVTADIAHWTGQECYILSEETIDTNTNNPTLPFYLVLLKLEDLTGDMLDHSILNELASEIILKKEHIEEDIIELIYVKNDKDDNQTIQIIPPHFHGELTSKIYEVCLSKYQQEHQQRQREHQRRGQRTGRQRGQRRRGRNGGGRE
uniref:Uncharacterized protein n=1 Tax=Meloidogyne hapla TaxID=6305 RepID=A0A1I8BDU3_MELHA